MATSLKLTKIGTSTGAVLPKEMLARMKVEKGDTLYAIETAEGYLITPYDPAIEDELKAAREFMKVLSRHFQRTCQVSSEPRWISKKALLLLHEESLSEFGGARGLRDEGLLESALARPRKYPRL